MKELVKTLGLGAVAVVLAVIATTSAPEPSVPDAFFDVGEPFFPAFTDPEMAASLRVVEWSDETGAALPFEVTNRGGLWTIPSHHGYPADGEERLSTAAAEVISVTKDDFRTDLLADHERMGVVDPLDESATTLEGRGTRLTFSGEGGQPLADLIVGRQILDRPGFRFLRVPGQNRVYAGRFGAEISTAFEDWIDTNLLEVEREQVRHIVLDEYFLNRETRQVVRRGEFVLDRLDTDEWVANEVPEGQEVDFVQANLLVGALLELEIAGVRPKPAGMTGNLREAAMAGRITQDDVLVLTSRGFYPTPEGDLLANEGALHVRTTDGVRYTLLFGEVVYGSGDAVAVGDETSDEAETGTGENRYVFITAAFDPEALPEPSPDDADLHASWERRVREGQARADRLATRFANWYYVVPADSYDRIHKPRTDFLRDVEPEDAEEELGDRSGADGSEEELEDGSGPEDSEGELGDRSEETGDVDPEPADPVADTPTPEPNS